MEPIKQVNGREPLSPTGRIITPEEYDALMSDLVKPDGPPCFPTIPQALDRVKKLEFNLMILVGLMLVVLYLSTS
jgi:hypothetical protein